MKSAEYVFDQAVVALRSNFRTRAFDLLAEVIRLDINHADAWSLRGRLEAEAGRYFNALLHHEKAVAAAPQRYDLWCNLAIDAGMARRYEASRRAFEQSLALKQTFEGHYNFGNLLSVLMEVDAAVHHYRCALRLDHGELQKAADRQWTGNAQLHTNLGVALITQGEWREGFNEYRHRFNAPGFPPRPRLDYPIWHGEPLEGKTILLYAEQGFGDEILSLRFARAVKEAGARVIVSVRPLVYRLARTLADADAVILQYDEPPWQPDYMCALLDVPANLSIWPHSLPRTEGYLTAEDRGLTLEWPEGLKVGICWASNRRPLQPGLFEMAEAKSLPLDAMLPLARKGVTLVSLQHQGPADALREAGIIDPMVTVQDFADTAWIVSQLDLVVTVDTALAHLAGAMGKPVWNLVRFDAMWPYMAEDGPTCWYDSMKLYRQTRPFDWTVPLNRLMTDFGQYVDFHSERLKLPQSPVARIDRGWAA